MAHTREEERVTDRAKVAGYVAVCGTCGGGWGAVSTSIPSIDVAAALLPWIMDGATVHAFTDAQQAEYLESLRARCTCPDNKFSHEVVRDDEDWPDTACPVCGEPINFADEHNDCRECGSEWTRISVLTAYRCEITVRGTLDPDEDS